MRRPLVAVFTIAAATMALAAAPGWAQQGQVPLPPGGFKPPPPAPAKPYRPLAVTPPAVLNDPSFVAFRNQLGQIVAHKDRAGLGKLVVAQNFFWIQDKDVADPYKSGFDNFAKAVGLDAQDDSGWQTLAGFANEPSAAESPQQKGVLCAPADPTLDPNAFEELVKATQTDPSEWGYPIKTGVEVHAAAQPNSPVIEKLEMALVRVLPDTSPPSSPNEPFFLHVATPSGKMGFVDGQSISPLGGDQMCYVKQAGAWKIAGYLGGASP
ncbi:MAG TPA: hypothetical protein VEI98_10365 [Xanthobacteraceae bacterium]|nr:hypothetical protein [Xanthobacteraceae bacterium]